MILTGILRHYLSTLLQSTPKRQLLAKIREQRSLGRAQNLRNNYQQVSKAAFERRKEAFLDGTKDGRFLADPDAKNKPKPNPMSDPAMMEGMMGMMKGNVAMMVPQSLIMGWINAFFSGYVISMTALRLTFYIIQLLTYISETALPAHPSIQANVASRCWHARLGREMGLFAVLVLPDALRSAARLQLHPGQQERCEPDEPADAAGADGCQPHGWCGRPREDFPC
jgi:hypothetical protein